MNRIVIALALPVGIFATVLTITMVLAWTRGTNLCDTWIAPILTYCR